MKTFGIYILICGFLTNTLMGQQQIRPLLEFESNHISFGIDKSGALFLASAMGEVATSPGWKQFWKTSKVGNAPLADAKIDNVNFFNSDTGIVSGFIYNNDKHNIIFRTVNGGARWAKVDFGQDGWVDHAVHNNSGEVWMSVSGSGIAYSSDFGSNWRKLAIPTTKQRYARIFFNQRHQGLIGSLWNALALTLDNGATWKELPTPLDQRKYKKTNMESRPEITQVGIWAGYLVVAQENLVFYSKTDSIDWKWLPGVSDFFIDAESDDLYIEKKNGGYGKMAAGFTETYQWKLPRIRTVACKNGNLYAVADGMIFKLQPNGGIDTSYLYLDKTTSSKPQPTFFTYGKKYQWGVQGNELFTSTYENEEWKYYGSLPFAPVASKLSFVKADEELAYHYTTDSLLYYNLHTKQQYKKRLQSLFDDFSIANITSIKLEKGTSGCFHHAVAELVYHLTETGFELEESKSAKDKDININPQPSNIPFGAAEALLKQLPTIFNGRTGFEELDFTEKDFQECKKQIAIFKTKVEKGTYSGRSPRDEDEKAFEMQENNIDFERLFSLVDSVRYINKEQLHETLLANNMMSTTSFWINISFINKAGRQLAFRHTYYHPNAFYIPSTIYLDGLQSISTNTAIYKFIKAAAPGLGNKASRLPILYKLIRKLY